MTSGTRALWRGRVLALTGIVLVAFSLRSAVGVLSPMLGLVQQDFAVPSWVAGLIGTAPPVCFAVFGIVTPMLERRFGLERLATAAMVVAAVGMAGRALSPNGGVLLLGTVVVFAAVGVGNVVLPPLVKRYFPDRVGQMTAVYSTTLAVSAFVPPLIAVPVADAAGWRFSLGMWALFAIVAAVPWAAMLVRARRGPDDEVEIPAPSVLGRMWRLPVAWALTISFSVSSAVAYTSFAWLPRILIDETGVSAAASGVLLSIFAAIGFPLSVVTPVLVVRYPRSVGWLYTLSAVGGFAGIAGLILAPQAATLVWVILYGLPQLLFPLVLVLIQARTRTHEASVALSGFTQSVGYAIAALFPLLFGVLHEATGGWTVPLLALGVLIAASIPAGLVVLRGRTVEQDWETHHAPW